MKNLQVAIIEAGTKEGFSLSPDVAQAILALSNTSLGKALDPHKIKPTTFTDLMTHLESSFPDRSRNTNRGLRAVRAESRKYFRRNITRKDNGKSDTFPKLAA